MIRQDQFPLTSYPGKSFQKEYRGTDIVIVISAGRGIDCIVMKDNKVLWKDHRKFIKVSDYFKQAEQQIDFLIEGRTDLRLQMMQQQLDTIKDKAMRAAKQAMATALSLSKDRKDLMDFFDFEIKKQFGKI